MNDAAKAHRCSFCGKRRDQVQWLIAGGAKRGSFICDECIRVASSNFDPPEVFTNADRPVQTSPRARFDLAHWLRRRLHLEWPIA